MTRGLQSLLLAMLLGVLAVATTLRPARAEEVDCLLVLAIDVSLSMDNEEIRLQREAYVAALRSPVVIEAARRGPLARIAVAVVEWSGTDEQRLIVPWMLIDGETTAHQVAAQLEAAPAGRLRRTDISSALRFSARLFDLSPWRSDRRVIDLSGDGSSNEGEPITEARDAIVAQGIVINGLPLVLDRVGTQMISPDAPPITLEDYYRECVIGGPGAFIVPVTEIADLPRALRTKLIVEIAGWAVPSPIIPASEDEAPRRIADCHGRFSF